MPRKAKKPTTSVTVVTKVPDETAGSIVELVEQQRDRDAGERRGDESDHHRDADDHAELGIAEPEAGDDAGDQREADAVQQADDQLAGEEAAQVPGAELLRRQRADGDRHRLRRGIAALARDDRREDGERDELRSCASNRLITAAARKAVSRLTKSQRKRLLAIFGTGSDSSSSAWTPPSCLTSSSAASSITSTMSSTVMTPTSRPASSMTGAATRL